MSRDTQMPRAAREPGTARRECHLRLHREPTTFVLAARPDDVDVTLDGHRLREVDGDRRGDVELPVQHRQLPEEVVEHRSNPSAVRHLSRPREGRRAGGNSSERVRAIAMGLADAEVTHTRALAGGTEPESPVTVVGDRPLDLRGAGRGVGTLHHRERSSLGARPVAAMGAAVDGRRAMPR